MDYSEKQIRDILELKEWITEEIEKRQIELERLKSNLTILDSVLKQSSFNKASSLISSPDKEGSVIPIKSGDNTVIANARITSNEVVIVPSKDVKLDVEMHPFK